MLVTAKKKFNFSMPAPLAEVFEASAGRWGEKRRWAACAAAVYLWLKTDPVEQDRLARRMADADLGGDGFETVLSELKRKAADGKPVKFDGVILDRSARRKPEPAETAGPRRGK